MLRSALKIILRSLLTIIIIVALYALAAFSLPFITVNNSFTNNKEGVKIFVLSNGVHTDIVVPANTTHKNWTVPFPRQNFDVTDSIYNYVGFGWGDKGFYLDTPTWADLKFSTAFKASFGLGSTAMHVRYLKQPKINAEKCVELIINSIQYKELISLVENSFQKNNDLVIKIDHPGYGSFDRFYEAKGTYSAFKTCNIWTNNCLKKTGVKVAIWSPFSKGLIHSLKQE